jgi:cytochrome bd-type quinol oxidase subunit 2
MRILALLVGGVLLVVPAIPVLGFFEEAYRRPNDYRNQPWWLLVALVLFYGCILAGVAFQRRRGRMGGFSAFRGALQSVIILAVIALLAPYVYSALTHTEPGNLAGLGGWLLMMFGGIAAVGTGLIVYGTQRSDVG